tara:strand:+ start:60 stop:485 length:426 start_codon:yes stop_codon:yes gene_type:complete
MYYLKSFIFLLLFFLISCSQNFQNNGLSDKTVKNFNVEIGKTSKKQLVSKYGPPIFENLFNNNTIYYVSHNTSYKTFTKRKTNKLYVFEIVLDDENIVKEFKKFTENDSLDLDISKKEDIDIDMSAFWKDIINAMRKNIGD